MRSLLLFGCLAISSTAFAQADKFAKENFKLYGSPVERAHQETIEKQSSRRYLTRLIGFKQYYLNELSAYIQQSGYTDQDAPFKPGMYILKFTKNGAYMGNAKPPKLTLTFSVDGDERIKQGTITGNFDALAMLFIRYWPMDAEWNTEVKLKPGVVAQKHSFGDLITFNWSGATPFIKVTKDPNINVPVPALVSE
jgi:hypothetical protein